MTTNAAIPMYWQVGLLRIANPDLSQLLTFGKYLSRSSSSVVLVILVFFAACIFAFDYSLFLLLSSVLLLFSSSAALALSPSWLGYSFLYSYNFDLNSFNFLSIQSFFFLSSPLRYLICLIWFSLQLMFLLFYFCDFTTSYLN